MPGPDCGDYQHPANLTCLTNIILPHVINSFFAFVGIVCLAMIIFAGFKYITARGDKKTIDTAHKTLFYAAIGGCIVLFSFFFLNVIAIATGINCLKPQTLFSNGIMQACQ